MPTPSNQEDVMSKVKLVDVCFYASEAFFFLFVIMIMVAAIIFK